MKTRIALLLFSIIITPRIYSQNNFKKYEITVSGNYQITTDDTYIGSYETNIKSNSTKFELGINRAISKQIMLGVGLDYRHCNEQYDYEYYNINNGFVVEGYPEIKTVTIIPSINLKYVRALSERFIAGLNLYNGYGFSTSELNSITDFNVDILVSELSSSKTGYEDKNDETFYTLSLEPEVCYYLTSSVGIKIKGEFYRFDSINKNQFFFKRESNQIAWTLGVSWSI